MLNVRTFEQFLDLFDDELIDVLEVRELRRTCFFEIVDTKFRRGREIYAYTASACARDVLPKQVQMRPLIKNMHNNFKGRFLS